MVGATKYLTMYAETTWGVLPTPAYYHIPVLSYDVLFRPERRRANPFTGLYQKKHGRNFRGMPSGGLSAELYGWTPTGGAMSAAEYLLGWALGSAETADLPSRGAEWAEGPNVANKRHSGLRINQATLAGSADAGNVTLQLDLMGQDEVNVVTAQTKPTDMKGLVAFDFADTVFTFDGEALAIDAFQLTVQHNLAVKYLNSRRPSLLVKTTRNVALTVTLPKGDDTWDVLRRSNVDNEYAATLVVKGLQAIGGSTYTIGTMSFDRLSFADAAEAGGRDELSMQTASFDVLKKDTSDNDVDIAWTSA